VIDGRPHESNVQSVRREPLKLAEAHHFSQDQIGALDVGPYIRQERRQKFISRPSGKTQAEKANLANGGPLSIGDQKLGFHQEPASLTEKYSTRRRKLNRSRRPLEKLNTD